MDPRPAKRSSSWVAPQLGVPVRQEPGHPVSQFGRSRGTWCPSSAGARAPGVPVQGEPGRPASQFGRSRGAELGRSVSFLISSGFQRREGQPRAASPQGDSGDEAKPPERWSSTESPPKPVHHWWCFQALVIPRLLG